MDRFVSNPPAESGWEILTSTVANVAGQSENPATGRLLAAELLGRIARDTVASAADEKQEQQNEVQCRALKVLLMICRGLGRVTDGRRKLATDETSDEVHAIALDTLRAIVEHIGDSLTEGWTAVFEIILSIFVPISVPSSEKRECRTLLRSRLCSVPLGRSAFGSVQLICSDFLTCVPDSSLLTMVDAIFRFCSQSQDLNISLTVGPTLVLSMKDANLHSDHNPFLESIGPSLRTNNEQGTGRSSTKC